MSDHLSRMAGAVDPPATGANVAGFVDTVTTLVAGLASALESIADGGCTLVTANHTGADCLTEFPAIPIAWCSSCTALAALAGAKLRASDA